MRNVSIILLALSFAACGSATHESSTTPAETSATADAVESPPPAEAVGSSECPLFCGRQEGGACMRPDYAEPPDSCGAFSSGRLGPATVACPESCCRVAGIGAGEDRDADGIFDADDRCPDAPEDVDGFEDHDGCSDTDNDRDGTDDPQDMCCYVAEDLDEDRDLDGCPE